MVVDDHKRQDGSISDNSAEGGISRLIQATMAGPTLCGDAAHWKLLQVMIKVWIMLRSTKETCFCGYIVGLKLITLHYNGNRSIRSTLIDTARASGLTSDLVDLLFIDPCPFRLVKITSTRAMI